MSNKNTLGIEGNALNLSLTGSQLNTSSSIKPTSQSSSRRPPSSRSVSARSNTNSYLDHVKLKKDRNNAGQQYKSRPDNLIKKFEVPAPEHTTKSTNKSNIFAPISVRSSTDDFDIHSRLNDFKSETTKASSGLELFFGRDSHSPDHEVKSHLSNVNNISPVKDEKINKLKSSVDNLRREFHREFVREEIQNRMAETKRKYSAIKIQRWYRQRNLDRANQLVEMQKLFDQKRNELKKKLTVESDYTAVTALNKKRQNNGLLAASKEQRSVAEKLAAAKPPGSPKQTSTASRSRLESPKTPKPESPKAPKSNNDDSQQFIQGLSSSNQNTTVESLLLSLDKIEKESSEFLKVNTDSNRDTSFSSTNTVTNESGKKVNSILSFLDDEGLKDTAVTFVPKPFKDYTLDLKDYEDVPEVKQTRRTSIASIGSKTSTTSKSTVKSKSVNQVSGNVSDLGSTSNTTNKKTSVKGSGVLSSGKQDIKKEEKLVKKPSIESMEETISHEIELTDKIMEQKMELADKTRQIAMLEKALSQQKELTMRHTHEADNEMQLRLQAQKNDYESTIQRHLSFIDQLIDDKKSLSEKCEKLIAQLTSVEKNYSDKFRIAEERYKVDSQKLKETFEAAEKIRREKWIEEKTKKIKEMTVKGLEPEIQTLITRHKNDIKTLKAVHEAELLQADERASQRYIKITEELRENYEREKEAAVQKEKDVCKQRYEKSLEEEEKSFLEQRRRLYKEIEEEKNRIAEQGAFQRKELDRLRRTLEENNLTSIEAIKKEYTQLQAEQEKKHNDELRNLTEKLEIEKQSWEQNHLKKQENWASQKERELRDKLKRERDKEIELLIAKLETESTLSREECERTAENRIKRVRDKYESELKEVEKTERDTMERFNTLKAKFNELEGEYEHLKVVFRQKEKEMEGIKKLTDVLQDERNRLADVIRQDFSDRLIFTEEENKRVKLELVEMKSRHQYDLDNKKLEFERLQREKAEELDTVHEKIKQVLAKKDETLAQLKQQYEAACKRSDHLEGLLEQQRSLMLKKQSNNAN